MLLAEVQACVETYAMLSQGDTVIVAVSGGADSMALLSVLLQLRAAYHLTIVVAHVNHQLRGVESERDALFVEQQARRLGVPFYQTRVDVRGLQRQARLAVHPAARQLRYRFFYALAAKLDATRVTLGHTSDDQAETVLMRLVRGASARGLAGIPAVRLPFMRPLLCVSRQTIYAYLRQEGIAWVEDSSNVQQTYLRNRVRHDLLPHLRRYNPQMSPRLNDVAELLHAEDAFLETQVDAWISPLVDARVAHRRTLQRTLFRTIPLAIQRRLLLRVTETFLAPSDGLSFRHIESLRQWMMHDTREKSWYGPSHLMATQHDETVVLWQRHKRLAMPDTLLLPVPGRVELPALNIRLDAEVCAVPVEGSVRQTHEAWLDLDAVSTPLTVRFWRFGDRFRPLGAPGSKKLQDFFIDSKIPQAERLDVPLVASQQTIVWVVGYRIAEVCKLRTHTHRAVHLQCRAIRSLDAGVAERARVHLPGICPSRALKHG